jgi:hypothetical protein
VGGVIYPYIISFHVSLFPQNIPSRYSGEKKKRKRRLKVTVSLKMFWGLRVTVSLA